MAVTTGIKMFARLVRSGQDRPLALEQRDVGLRVHLQRSASCGRSRDRDETEVTRVWRKHIQHPTKAEAEVHIVGQERQLPCSTSETERYRGGRDGRDYRYGRVTGVGVRTRNSVTDW